MSADANSHFVSFPFGGFEEVDLTATGAQAIAVGGSNLLIDGVSTVATGNRTLNLTVGSNVTVGTAIFLKSKTTGTETTVFGTGFTAPTITGVAGKTFSCMYVYDGAAFRPVGTAVQND